jgi:hypothetical protein
MLVSGLGVVAPLASGVSGRGSSRGSSRGSGRGSSRGFSRGFSASGYSVSGRGSVVSSRGASVPCCGVVPTRAPSWRSA